MSEPSRAPAHLHAVDVVRLLTVLGVIAVHVIALTLPADDLAAGAMQTQLHVTREVFVLLSAFVLTYSYRNRALERRTFWHRRYPLVVIPYVAWTVIYVIANGSLMSPWHATATVLTDLGDGGASYHLYFLAVTLQLYLVFPWVLRCIRRWSHRAGTLLAASFGLQLAFTCAIHYQVALPQPFAGWLAHPDALLPSYQLYVIGGTLAALHFEDLTEWLRRQRQTVTFMVMAAAVAGLASFVLDIGALDTGVVRASEVFQPGVVVESLAFTLGLYALGLWAVDRLSSRGLRRLETTSDISFGVFLAHPLVLQGLLSVAIGSGVLATLQSWPSPIALTVALGIGVPTLYFASAALTVVARRTPVSLMLTGRRRLATPAREAIAPAKPALQNSAEPSMAGAT
jgi:peptidoglycan/LPS O-acetylase OafA/YrhL